MSRSTAFAAALAAGALIIAGCGDNSSSSTTTTAASAATTTTASSGQTTTTGSSSSSSDTVAVASNSTIGQSILVDGQGRTVYMFEPDGTNTTSQVPAAIAANWPPVTVTGTPTAGNGADASLVGAAMQSGGTNQATYNGHLIYTYAGDSSPGDANGQGLGGVWFVLSASGDKIG